MIWGVLHAVYQIIGDMTKGLRQKAAKALRLNPSSAANQIVKIVVTFILVDFAWIFFRAESLSQALAAIKSIFMVFNPWILMDDSLFSLGIGRRSFSVMMLGLLLLMVVDLMKTKGISVRRKLQAQDGWFRCAAVCAAVWFIVTVGIWGSAYNEASFIYLQF